MSTTNSFSDTDEKKGAHVDVHVAVADREVDTAAQLVAALNEEITPEESMRLRKKIDWHILPLMCSEYPLVLAYLLPSLTDAPLVQFYTGFNSWTRRHWVVPLFLVSGASSSHSKPTRRDHPTLYRTANHLTTNQCVPRSLICS